MNNYETVFIVTPVLSEAQVQEVADKFQGVITENGGQIVNMENWGLKKLAYPIQKKTTGFYFLVEFTGEGSIINTLETQYRRDERIIRFLTFKQDKFAVGGQQADQAVRRGKYPPVQHTVLAQGLNRRAGWRGVVLHRRLRE